VAESTVPSSPTVPDSYVLVGGTVLGLGPADVWVRDGRIEAVGAVASDATPIDVTGQCISAGFIDSHVHLAYLAQADEMAAGGVVAAVDLAAPLSFLQALPDALEVRAAGPMITAVNGYPTQSWGQDGYGLEVADAAAAAAAVGQLAEAGAALIKVPITSEPTLGADALTAAVEAAHARGLKVAAHALGDVEAELAADVGVDVLAHTPTGALSDETVQKWSERAVISTLRAFGGSATTVDNLTRLRAAGATVLYGTDFGNTRTAGIDETELGLLVDAGLSAEDLRIAATLAPAEFWGFDDLGSVEVGKRAALWVGDCSCLFCP